MYAWIWCLLKEVINERQEKIEFIFAQAHANGKEMVLQSKVKMENQMNFICTKKEESKEKERGKRSKRI